MPTVSPPQYSKVNHPTTGASETCYTFNMKQDESESNLTYVTEDEPSLEMLSKALQENTEWWSQWVSVFLASTTKFFSKPYTVQQVQAIMKHTLRGESPSLLPAHLSMAPESIQIRNGTVWVNWKYDATPLTIDIPDIEKLPDSNEAEEWNGEDVPVDPNATDEPLSLDTPTKFYDKHKAKQARWKAKVAMYRAQQQMNKYYEKYGVEVSDSDTEETSDDEEEEVQL